MGSPMAKKSKSLPRWRHHTHQGHVRPAASPALGRHRLPQQDPEYLDDEALSGEAAGDKPQLLVTVFEPSGMHSFQMKVTSGDAVFRNFTVFYLTLQRDHLKKSLHEAFSWRAATLPRLLVGILLLILP